MHLWVGLGNVGSNYAKNRHNIGFMAVEALADTYGFSAPKQKFHGDLREGLIAGQKVLLLCPSTYMNRSGISVAEAASFYKINLERVVVFHDDLDLPLGNVRVKIAGGHGGHNGLKSLDQHLGNAYVRVRLGIGHPGMKEKVVGHVLGDFSQEEVPVVETLCKRLAQYAPDLIKGERALYAKQTALPAVGLPSPQRQEGRS